MTVWFVGAGPGDPELLTRKASRLLQSAQVCIYAGSLINPQILEELPSDCDVYDSAGMNLDEIIQVIRTAHEQGRDVIRLHTGEPSIYGAIAEQMRRLDGDGISYEVVPGISSFQAAAAAIKVELTAPEISQTVILSRMAGRTPVPPSQELERLAATQSTLCLFLTAGMLEDASSRLIPYYGADCPAALVYRASWPDQVVIRGTLADLPAAATDYTRTAMILVGHALAESETESRLYDATFSHGYREGDSSSGDDA